MHERRLRVLELASRGESYREIERQTSENRGTISRWVRSDLAAYQAAQALGAQGLDVGDLGHLVAGLEGDVIGQARSLVVQHTVQMLHTVITSAATPLRERLAAADRLRSWVETSPTLEEEMPPAPALPPTGPAVCSCVACDDCDGARWSAWVERVVWARRQPLATDRSAIRAAGTLVSDDIAAEWLCAGAADIAARVASPAAEFAGRFAAAAGDAIARLLAEHAEALSRGDGRAAQAALQALERTLPEEYLDRPEPLLEGAEAEDDVARILRVADERRSR